MKKLVKTKDKRLHDLETNIGNNDTEKNDDIAVIND